MTASVHSRRSYDCNSVTYGFHKIVTSFFMHCEAASDIDDFPITLCCHCVSVTSGKFATFAINFSTNQILQSGNYVSVRTNLRVYSICRSVFYLTAEEIK